MASFTVIGPSGPGHLVTYAGSNATQGLFSVLVYAPATNIANAVAAPVADDQLTARLVVSGAHLAIDVFGYYMASSPNRNTNLGTSAGEAGELTQGNTAIGHRALSVATRSATDPSVTGSYNTGVGDGALERNVAGHSNTACGWGALTYNFNGTANTALGLEALVSNQTGSYNIGIGHYAGWQLGSGSNNIYIAHEGAATAESNTIRIGRHLPGTYNPAVHTATYIAGINGSILPSGAAVYVDDAGRLGVLPSSERFKRDVAPIGDLTDKLMALRPVSFLYDVEEAKPTLQYGLLAEEVARTFPELVKYDEEGLPTGVQYHLLIPVLLKEIQEQRRELEALKQRR